MVPPFLNISAVLLFLHTLCFLSLSPISKATPTFSHILCPNTTTYSPNSTYKANLNTLLSVLSSNATTSDGGFYNFTAGNNSPDVSYGLFLCRGDLSPTACHDCVSTATTEVVRICPESKWVVIWYDECMLRYSDRSIFSIMDSTNYVMLPEGENVTESERFSESLRELMGELATRASSSNRQLGFKNFATGEAKLSANQTLYGLEQCTPDITSLDCNSCLTIVISSFTNLYDRVQGGRVLSASCNVRYETYPFYTLNATAPPPPRVETGSDPPPPPPPVEAGSAPPPPPPVEAGSGRGGISWRVLIAIIVPIGVIGFCVLCSKTKKKYWMSKPRTSKDEITALQSLRYDLSVIRAATNNFSDDNKIGKGGFGPVYKGTLPNGEEVAVKRLSKNSRQGAEQFENEVVLIAKIQHLNLVRLLGFCLEGEEKILIYEFVPNNSLDKFLFDPQDQVKLDWPQRYKIIQGIADGMLYLHEYSRLRIIHRDLKAGNILLDGNMIAKISDFGMARIFGVDQTRAVTSRVVGTLGYISPEYAMHGQFSVKSDVFSFGVLLLEVISGKKTSSFYRPDCVENLLNYAWKLWRDGTPLDLMDPALEGSYSRNEVIRCIHIGLLCVQHNPDARPTMAMVVRMLNRYSAMSLPQQPAFLTRSRSTSNTLQGLEPDRPTDEPMLWPVNESSVAELDTDNMKKFRPV